MPNQPEDRVHNIKVGQKVSLLIYAITLVYMCQKLWILASSRQSYGIAKIIRLTFLALPVYRIEHCQKMRI